MSAQLQPQLDASVSNHGTLCQFHLISQAALDWVEAHVDAPDYMWMGQRIFNCETRYAGGIVEGMINAGLTVNG